MYLCLFHAEILTAVIKEAGTMHVPNISCVLPLYLNNVDISINERWNLILGHKTGS